MALTTLSTHFARAGQARGLRERKLPTTLPGVNGGKTRVSNRVASGRIAAEIVRDFPPEKLADATSLTPQDFQEWVIDMRKRLARLTQAFRAQYYQLARRVLDEQRQVIPCQAGWASGHIAPDGDVWTCCIPTPPALPPG